jgi:hypothetical protein
VATKVKKTRFKSIESAEARIRILERRIQEYEGICTRYKGDYETAQNVCLMLAKLAADGPAFYNPLEAMAAKQGRDMILHGAGINPDGSPISK